ncbi:unnamed protein product [Urochloa decumbens]|uniref:F-box domain-containing protein n=1 Tax=Urochloa decumbens TaxID=240449 RepID=A0ABC9C4W0_9POAL
MADKEGFSVPTDALTEIFLRLPTSARRRFRLVCKLWRDAIDERTPERQVQTKILAFISHGQSSRAIVFDDKDGHRRQEWAYNSTTRGVVEMVGTCNGLICLHDADAGDRSVITVANPITGEAVALPPPPAAWGSLRRRGLYAFGYHPTTGRYKVVHVPSRLARRQDAVHVLTLCDDGSPAAWREVVSPALSGSHNPLCGIVSVDGSVYWFTSGADRVVALDVGDDERVTSFLGPPGVHPVERMPEASWKVTSVHARLGVVIPRCEMAAMTMEVWVLDAGGGEAARWSRMYCLRDNRSSRIVTSPHLTHGEYVLSASWDDGKRLYRRKVCGTGATNGDDRSAAPLQLSEGAEVIMSEETEGWLRTFAYAETREPLPSVGR